MFDGGTTDMRILLGLGAIVGRARLRLPAAAPRQWSPFHSGLRAFLALSSYSVLGSARMQSLGALASQGVAPKDVSWVDDRVGTDADVVFVNNISLADEPAHALADRVLEPEHRDGRGPRRAAVTSCSVARATIDRPDRADRHQRPVRGELGPHAPYAVAPTALELAGTVIAKPGSLLALYRVDHPLRLARAASGLYTDGWTAGDMALSQYATPGQRSGRSSCGCCAPPLVRAGAVGPARATLEVGRLRVGRGASETGAAS